MVSLYFWCLWLASQMFNIPGSNKLLATMCSNFPNAASGKCWFGQLAVHFIKKPEKWELRSFQTSETANFSLHTLTRSVKASNNSFLIDLFYFLLIPFFLSFSRIHFLPYKVFHLQCIAFIVRSSWVMTGWQKETYRAKCICSIFIFFKDYTKHQAPVYLSKDKSKKIKK